MCILHTIIGLALETFIAPVELLNASCEQGATLNVAIGAQISDSKKPKNLMIVLTVFRIE